LIHVPALFSSALVCDLLPRRLFHGLPKAHCQKSILVTIFKEHCLEDTRLIWCLSYPGAWRQRGSSPELPRATWSRPNQGKFCTVFFDLRCPQIGQIATCYRTLPSQVAKMPTCGGRNSLWQTQSDPLRVGKTDHNVGGLACILGLTNPHNQSP